VTMVARVISERSFCETTYPVVIRAYGLLTVTLSMATGWLGISASASA